MEKLSADQALMKLKSHLKKDQVIEAKEFYHVILQALHNSYPLYCSGRLVATTCINIIVGILSAAGRPAGTEQCARRACASGEPTYS